jgi:hypothetical protein
MNSPGWGNAWRSLWRRLSAPATIKGGKAGDFGFHAWIGAWIFKERGFLSSRYDGGKFRRRIRVGFRRINPRGSSQGLIQVGRIEVEFEAETTLSPERPHLGLSKPIYRDAMIACRQSLEANRSLLRGWGDQGDLGESSTHLKPREESIALRPTKRTVMASASRDNRIKVEGAGSLVGQWWSQGRIPGEISNPGQGAAQDEGKNWAMEVVMRPSRIRTRKNPWS